MQSGGLGVYVRSGWWKVLLATMLGIGCGVLATAVTTPVYQSTVRFYVFAPTAPGQTALQADELARLRIIGYASLLTSERVVEEISATAGVERSADELVDQIAAQGDPDTLLLTVNVRSADQDEAVAVGQSIATNFNRIVNDLEGAGNPDVAKTVLNLVSGPTRDDNPVSPREKLNVGLGGLVGLALGLGLVVARAQADRSYRSSDALERDFDLPLLATLPAPDSGPRGVPTSVELASLRWEAVRNLRTNLSFRTDAKHMKVLVATSTTDEEFAAPIAYLLATVYAEAGYRTLLVEADLRHPQIASEFKIDSDVSFNKLLDDQNDVALGEIPNIGANLFLLAASSDSSRATELLSASFMQDVLNLLRREFDIVIVSAASVLPFSDARSICALADGVVLITSFGKTTSEQIEAAKESLDMVRAPLIGLVFDGMPVSGRAPGGPRNSRRANSRHAKVENARVGAPVEHQ
jgi:succinoglycan biosynthesis transport protein ExoP